MGGDSVLLMALDANGQARFHGLDLQVGAAPPTHPVSVSFECEPLARRILGFGFRAAPDGRLAAAQGKDGRILIVPLDGGAPRPMPGGEVNEQPVQWSPDGRRLYCYRRGQMPAAIIEVDVASGRRRPWATIQPPGPATTQILLLLSHDLRTGVYGYDDTSADLYLVDGLRRVAGESPLSISL